MNKFLCPAALVGLFALTACGQAPEFLQRGKPANQRPAGEPLSSTTPGGADLSDEVRAVVAAPPPPSSARTADEFDTTTSEQRAKAEAAPTGGGERRLGETVASLGDPTQSGFWIKSPLVKTPGSGRIENPTNGKSAQVELIPLDGPESGGSQVSLAALRLIEAPITDLPTLVVYAN
ncbi:hypothetical protein [Oceaniglobus trochenteri]|uniref:hypothetical protein n=1 Tax=Oceaniglobus trochenteri TaxID=2763260 RepID=UPI001CFFF6AA|nr:hypothetical protein [Oceaniglobus trochenteri]